MSNSPLMDMFYKMWVDGERDPQTFLDAGKAKSDLCSLMHVQRYLTQFEKGLTPDKVKRDT